MSIRSKICLQNDLLSRLGKLPRPLVMTNGVFDILHRGHVSYLQRSAQLGLSLLVAVNDDDSARMLGKGPNRPLNCAEDRAYILAGLRSVDLVTFFSTRTPVELIQVVRPDIYVKGGDYDMDELEETRVVRSWGGQTFAIPFVDGYSTSGLVERILQNKPGLRKAVFLDRDGVINKDKAYVYRWEDFEFAPGSIDGLKKLQEAGYALVIITNQSGLARGYYSKDQYYALNKKLSEHLLGHGVILDGIYHCPHHPMSTLPDLAVVCECRKPKPGLILKAAHEMGLSLSNSVLIGDKTSDILAARSAGVGRAYSVDSYNIGIATKAEGSDGHFPSLLDCSSYLTMTKDTESL